MDITHLTEQEQLLIKEISKIQPRAVQSFDILEFYIKHNFSTFSDYAKRMIKANLYEAARRLENSLVKPRYSFNRLWLNNFIKKSFTLFLAAGIIALMGYSLHHYIFISLKKAGFLSGFVSKRYIRDQFFIAYSFYGTSAFVALLAFLRGVIVGARVTSKQMKKNAQIKEYCTRISQLLTIQ